MPNHSRQLCVFLVTTLLSCATFATPALLTDASAENAAAALDTPISQLWQTQAQMAKNLQEAGLNVDYHDKFHDHGMGIGGNIEPDIGALESDSLSEEIDELSENAQRRQDSLDRLSESLSQRPANRVHLQQLFAVEPVAYARISSNYGYRTAFGRGQFHKGIDLAAPYGTPIYATGKGVVVFAGWMSGYGNLIEIDHGNGYTTRYAHSSRMLVSVGDDISANQKIALVGCTGTRCTGPHLHYEVRVDGRAQNPSTYLALAPRRDD